MFLIFLVFNHWSYFMSQIIINFLYIDIYLYHKRSSTFQSQKIKIREFYVLMFLLPLTSFCFNCWVEVILESQPYMRLAFPCFPPLRFFFFKVLLFLSMFLCFIFYQSCIIYGLRLADFSFKLLITCLSLLNWSKMLSSAVRHVCKAQLNYLL